MATSVNPIITFMGQPGMGGQYSNRTVGVLPENQLTEDKDGGLPVQLLDQRHPEYEMRYEEWLDLALLYEGGNALKNRAERLLKKRPREDEEVYAARLDNFTSQNILSTALGWYGAAMFEDPPEIFFNGGEGTKYYAQFLDNCDGLRTSLVDMFKTVFQVLLTYGSAWVVTDVSTLEQGQDRPLTKQDERNMGMYNPHLIPLTPLNVINWKTDKLGDIEWLIVRMESEQQENFRSPKMIVTNWYYFDRTDFLVYEDRRSPQEQVKVATDQNGRIAKLVNQGKHCLSHVGRVPVRRLAFSQGLWLANRSYLVILDHLNQDNTLKWALMMSNLAMPVIIGDGDFNQQTYSEVGFLQFPSGTEYKWTEPEGKSFKQSADRVDSLREECFRSMYLQAQGRSMHATPAMQSGRSKQLEMIPARQVLSGMGDDVRNHMQLVLIDVRDARHESNVEPDVRGFNFDEDMTTEQVFAVNSVLGMKIPSKTFEKYLMKKVVKAWMEDANRKELNTVYVEIDEGPTLQEQAEAEMKNRAEISRQGLIAAANKIQMPPGRGGAGPKPPESNEKGGE